VRAITRVYLGDSMYHRPANATRRIRENGKRHCERMCGGIGEWAEMKIGRLREGDSGDAEGRQIFHASWKGTEKGPSPWR